MKRNETKKKRRKNKVNKKKRTKKNALSAEPTTRALGALVEMAMDGKWIATGATPAPALHSVALKKCTVSVPPPPPSPPPPPTSLESSAFPRILTGLPRPGLPWGLPRTSARLACEGLCAPACVRSAADGVGWLWEGGVGLGGSSAVLVIRDPPPFERMSDE
ncbi:hypothetical protein T492DRAFT_833341 [Pavlovales sp. CCMP2436]|nr:hypothetical protein T492DRAFT_833341 [Pavlovales sp. CCMP2436]